MNLTTVDPLDYIRKRPERFLRSGTVTGVELAEILAGDALLLTDAPVTVFRKQGWWIVAGEADWMEGLAGGSVTDLFAHLVPFPQAGVNSMHAEVLLTAFADAVLTATGCAARVIKGTVSQEDAIWEAMKANPRWQRVVAFRLDASRLVPSSLS
jgi:hypothetical protein